MRSCQKCCARFSWTSGLIRKNIYIKAIIEVSSYDGKTIYTAIKFNQINNHNYVTFHFLDCLYSQKIRREGFKNSSV